MSLVYKKGTITNNVCVTTEKRIDVGGGAVLPTPTKLSCAFPTGPLVTLLFSAAICAGPLVYLYTTSMTSDYSADNTRAIAASVTFVSALLVFFSLKAETLFNLSLFLHIGFEVFLVDKVFEVARNTSDTTLEVMSYVGGSVIIVHLLPFLLYNGPRTLTFFAFVGIPVNTLLILFSVPSLGYKLLFDIGVTSIVLLSSCILIAPKTNVALVPALMTGIRERKLLTFESFTLERIF
jgi:hypothetical protein